MSQFDKETGVWQDEDRHKFDDLVCANLIKFLEKEDARTIVDFGCGDASYVHALSNYGFFCNGFDGNPNTPELSDGRAEVLDLSKKFEKNTWDWVISLEVGEHIPKEYEEIFIDNLHRHNSKGVILSWAVPGQGGYGHVNEQPNSYIEKIFLDLGYISDRIAATELRSQTKWPWFKNTIMVFRK